MSRSHSAAQSLPATCPRHLARLLLVLVLVMMGIGARPALADTTIYAAASLTDVLPALVKPLEEGGAGPIKISFAASSALARQIDNGAEADLFISADEEWVDFLEQHHRLVPGSRTVLAGNSLVLIAPADSPLTAQPLTAATPLAQWLGAGRLAVGDPAHVPAGRYARAALEHLGLWQSLARQLAPADSVRTALHYVAQGETPLGIVYATDALGVKAVKVIGRFDPATHPPVRYLAAQVAGSASLQAAQILRALAGPASAKIWQASGFLPPP